MIDDYSAMTFPEKIGGLTYRKYKCTADTRRRPDGDNSKGRKNVEKYDNDYVAIFSADDLNSVIASSRVGRFKLLVDSYNGIHLLRPLSILTRENNIGVYVKKRLSGLLRTGRPHIFKRGLCHCP